MKTHTALCVSAIALLSACTAITQAPIPISKESVAAVGEGNSVSARGRSIPLAGTAIKVGDRLPAVSLAGGNMAPVDLLAGSGKVRVLSIVPSIDTRVCEEQTHHLSEKTDGLDKQIELVTISMDLPMAQRRFAESAKIQNVTFLSDFRGANFGNKTGLLQKTSQLLARAVLVVDKNNVVRYMQVVPDVTSVPDLVEAFKFARTLI
jgi:thioredoxin-dependent peroxiredoxin